MKKVVFIVTLLSIFLGYSLSTFANNTDVYTGYWKTSGSNPPSQNLTVAVGTSLNSNLSLITGAAMDWNGISPNIKIKSVTSTKEADTSFPANINIRGVNLGSTGAWADALNYKYSILSGYTADWNAEWRASRIRVNTNSDVHTKKGFEFHKTDLRKKIIRHEVGHSLGLKHPEDKTLRSIMKQGDNGYYTIQTVDRNNLTNKYK